MVDNSGTIETGQTDSNAVLGTFWPTFNVDSAYFDVEECAAAASSMAVFTLQEYQIPMTGSAGGPLSSIDIKRMDAMTVINQSLMEEISTDGYLVEPIVNENGAVEFVQIGSTGGGISDVYYTVQTQTLVDIPKGVMVTGKKPLPFRNKIEWKPIWGEGEDANLHIYNYRDMLSNCNLEDFSRYAMLTFNDPYLDSKYADGVDNLFDITNPWTTLMGYAYYKKIPSEIVAGNSEYSIDYTKSALVPVKVGESEDIQGGIVQKAANLGSNLAILPQYDSTAAPGDCWSDPNQGVSVTYEDGVIVPMRGTDFDDLLYTNARYGGTFQLDKYIGINEVYVIGIEVAYMRTSPASNADAKLAQTSPDYNYTTWISIDDKRRRSFKLNAGKHYVISYDPSDTSLAKQPYINFSKDVKASDPAPYGTNQPFYLYQGCRLARELGPTESTKQFFGSILPIERNRAILVEEIWVLMELDTPSIIINDPKGSAAEIAENLIYYAAAMRVTKEPAPIGFANATNKTGVLVDQKKGVQDNDPTTAIDVEVTSELEGYYDDMQGGGMALTLSFLNEAEVKRVASVLYNYMDYNGVSTVHTCGPCCQPKLGRKGTTGTINSIQYSYSDKGSYTISVQEGPKVVGGLTSVDGGPTQKMAEDHQATAVIIKDAGNSVHFKVLIDGYGERWAFSTQHKIMRTGDLVSVTVHNNPVEA